MAVNSAVPAPGVRNGSGIVKQDEEVVPALQRPGPKGGDEDEGDGNGVRAECVIKQVSDRKSNPPVAPGQLTEKDLPELMNVLVPVYSKWDSVCLQLGVPLSTLSNIQAKPTLLAGAPQTFLQAGLCEWLKCKTSPHTVSSLVDALRTPSVDEAVLAEAVKDALTT